MGIRLQAMDATIQEWISSDRKLELNISIQFLSAKFPSNSDDDSYDREEGSITTVLLQLFAAGSRSHQAKAEFFDKASDFFCAFVSGAELSLKG